MRNTSNAQEDARRLIDLLTELGRRHPLRDPFTEVAEVTAMTPAQFHGLMWLGVDGPLTMGELARRIGITEKTVTGIVDRLEKRGFASRQRCTSDRRVVQVDLTEEGSRMWADLDDRVLERTATFLSALPDEDRATLIRIMTTLIHRLNESRREP